VNYAELQELINACQTYSKGLDVLPRFHEPILTRGDTGIAVYRTVSPSVVRCAAVPSAQLPFPRLQSYAIRSWNRSELPGWLNEKAYKREILPRLSKFTVKAIRLALDVPHPYATNKEHSKLAPPR